MKVLHCPIEIAGQMGILSKGLQKKGYQSIAYNTFHTYLGYRDYVHNVDIFELGRLFPQAIHHFDLFHFHYRATMLQEFRDLAFIKSFQKPMIMHHWGNDVRTYAIASLNNPYVFTGDSPDPTKIDQDLKMITQFIDHAIVQDYEVYPYVSNYYKHVHVLPIAFDVKAVSPKYPSTLETNPLVIHAPTNPSFKGTVYVEAAVVRLKSEGIPFRYQRIEQMNNAQSMQLYQEADIVIDQILCGSYGMFAVESMSLGKPVISYIRDDLVGSYPKVPPIHSANLFNIYNELKRLILDPTLRFNSGITGRQYAEEYHQVDRVIGQLDQIYKQIAG